MEVKYTKMLMKWRKKLNVKVGLFWLINGHAVWYQFNLVGT